MSNLVVKRARRRPRCLARLETLEDRTLLSVCVVDRLTDLGEGKELVGDLRYCLTQAQNGDSIQFAVIGAIELTSALPELTRSISIEGPGANLLTVRRNTGGNYRIFTVTAGATVGLSGLTAADGSVVLLAGGGVFNAGTLTISDCTIAGNTARAGGGIANSAGTLIIQGSTVSGNAATGGGPAFGGGILNTGALTVINSTISGNRASFFEGAGGGGIMNTSSGVLTVTSSTIAGNQAISTIGSGAGGGLNAGGTVRLRSTILADNLAGGGPDLFGRLASSGYNLIGSSTGGSGYHATDLLDVDPLLGPLRDNGGPTQTHALLPGSPAIDGAKPRQASPEWDQRGPGFPRVVGLNMDIGAFEVQSGGSPGPGQPDLAGALSWLAGPRKRPGEMRYPPS